MTILERNQKMEECRLKGMTYEEISAKFGLSKQRVYQIIGGNKKRTVSVKEHQCIYPRLRKWLNENNMCVNSLTRKIYGSVEPRNRQIIARLLEGGDSRKSTVEKVLNATGLTYEQAFYREEEGANND